MRLLNRPASPFDTPSFLFELSSSPIRFLAQRLNHLILSFRRPSVESNPSVPRVCLICLSDTHTKKTVIPDGDVLIHAGDLTNAGSVAEIQEQIDWLASLPHPHKIVIAGVCTCRSLFALGFVPGFYCSKLLSRIMTAISILDPGPLWTMNEELTSGRSITCNTLVFG